MIFLYRNILSRNIRVINLIKLRKCWFANEMFRRSSKGKPDTKNRVKKCIFQN